MFRLILYFNYLKVNYKLLSDEFDELVRKFNGTQLQAMSFGDYMELEKEHVNTLVAELTPLYPTHALCLLGKLHRIHKEGKKAQGIN